MVTLFFSALVSAGAILLILFRYRLLTAIRKTTFVLNEYAGREQFTRLFDSMPCGLVLLDALRDEGGRIVDFKYHNVNSSLRDIIGMDQRELLGQTVKRFFPDIRVTSGNMKNSDLVEVNTKALEGGAHTFHVYDPNRDTYQEIVSFRLAPDRVGTFIVDETARIQSELALQESETEYRTLFDQIPDGLALFDVERDESDRPIRFLYSKVNQALERINGMSNDDIHGREIREIVPHIELIDGKYMPSDTDEHWIFKLARTATHEQQADYQMSEMDGYEATRHIRRMMVEREKDGSRDYLPIIALTANATREDRENCLEAGMDAFCGKPANAEQLLTIIRQWTRER